MFSSVCSSPQQGFRAEPHKLCRHVDAKISVLGPTLTFCLCCGPAWDLCWHQLPGPILLQPGFVPGKCPCMRNVMGLFLGSSVLMQGEAVLSCTSWGEVQIHPSTSLRGADFSLSPGEPSFPCLPSPSWSGHSCAPLPSPTSPGLNQAPFPG